MKMVKWVWFVVPVLVIGALIVVGSLFKSSNARVPEVVQPSGDAAYFSRETLTDTQEAVEVAVSQINLNGPGETLDFSISMSTHSVNLDMDLVKNAFLTTDSGLTILPIQWDAPAGGHHISGTLSFAPVLGDTVVLEGTTRLTLTIRNVDAPERVFTWELQAPG
jgi:hypothetical protein